VTYPRGSFYVNSTNYLRAGDTAYVNMRSNSMSTSGLSATDMYYYLNADVKAVGGTGSFFVRPDSDSDILTYARPNSMSGSLPGRLILIRCQWMRQT